MNRLIIVGNGFDLAHGLPTSYNDFMIWYLNNCFKSARGHNFYEDSLIQISTTDFFLPFGPFQSEADLINHFYNSDNTNMLFNPIIKMPGYSNDFHNPFSGNIKSNFLRALLSKCNSANWVAIENEYYEQLKGHLNAGVHKAIWINKLNNEMAFIIQKLKEYLHSLAKPGVIDEYREIVHSQFDEKEFNIDYIKNDRRAGGQPFNLYPKNTLILNFNYTDTFFKYLKLSATEPQINYIHGQIDDDQKNPIIFGFGDELDKNYERFETETTKGFLNFIKSFWYLKTTNYHDLIRFVDSDYFQVIILGHSCGLSDRTMLNMVFEHDHCRSIKIYYYNNGEGEKNYTDLTQEISRHFKDKGSFRKKLVNYKYCSPMPQIEVG